MLIFPSLNQSLTVLYGSKINNHEYIHGMGGYMYMYIYICMYMYVHVYIQLHCTCSYNVSLAHV